MTEGRDQEPPSEQWRVPCIHREKRGGLVSTKISMWVNHSLQQAVPIHQMGDLTMETQTMARTAITGDHPAEGGPEIMEGQVKILLEGEVVQETVLQEEEEMVGMDQMEMIIMTQMAMAVADPDEPGYQHSEQSQLARWG